MTQSVRAQAMLGAASKTPVFYNLPSNPQGRPLKVSQFFGDNVYKIENSKSLTDEQKKEIRFVIDGEKTLDKELADAMSNSVLEWALEKGVTHFCHWFQPLTGATAEKHDSFLAFDQNRPIEKLSASQLMQGEPDASSFPHGGSRSTFEARGYTSWDLTSPIFITEGINGKTLCIPTAFVSYHGDALDMKTPLLRSISAVDKVVKEFLSLTGKKDVKKVSVTCGTEQEYFLVDKAYYFQRPDLVMSGRTLFGSVTSRNQQLEDHYFGTIPQRVQAFMNELEVELYKLGVPCKTRHNEVAPGQFELAPIFTDANTASDNNQLTMALLRSVAEKHGFVCLLHEKPFAGINGSGKHCNWSMSDDTGTNLLSPGANPHQNFRFLATVSLVVKAVKDDSEMLRMSIASHGNDHRLGANEAPPSILSVFLGETLTGILESIAKGEEYAPAGEKTLDIGAKQLAEILKDNTDRNRTSPFAFTGNKFEFRAVGSSASIGFPLSILNAAIASTFSEANKQLKLDLESGKSVDDALNDLVKKTYSESSAVVFSGDGYSEDWVKEAKKRGLPNLRTTADALATMKDDSKIKFLVEHGVYRSSELKTRYNVLLERYVKHREIEFDSLTQLLSQHVFPAAFTYKRQLAESVAAQKSAGVDNIVELDVLKSVDYTVIELAGQLNAFKAAWEKARVLSEEDYSLKMANELLPMTEKLAELCNQLELQCPDSLWTLPNYYEMLFIR